MTEAIRLLIMKWACGHDWDVHAERTVRDIDDGTVYFRRTYICKKCGKFKQLKV